MNEETLATFFHGAASMGYAVAALYFFRAHRSARGRIFAYFGFTFLVLALDYAAIALLQPTDENRVYYYAPRLIAFLSIIAGIVDANRSAIGKS